MNDPLQFDHAELASPSACGACKAPLGPSYFQAAGQMLCGHCTEEVRKAINGTGTRGGRLMRAALFGVGAGILGALIYFAVLELTGLNVGLVAILVGILVGRAVRRGSGGRGGRGYQFLAAGITYLSIAATFLPMALAEIGDETKSAETATVDAGAGTTPDAAQPDAAAPVAAASAEDPAQAIGLGEMILGIGALLVLTLSLPVLIAFGGGVISLLIVAFGVWEAWRVNKRIVIDITGPHHLVAQPPSLPAANA